jgi:hypothetical protein
MPSTLVMEVCSDCGVALAPHPGERHAYLGGSAACWALFGQVLAREYADAAYWPAHRTTVDAYAAQHPGRPEPRTIQSIHVHLLGLCFILEHDLAPAFAGRALGALVQEKGALRWLDPPADLGRLTVADIAAVSTPEAHLKASRAWGEAVWAAWAAHHAEVRARAQTIITRQG